MARFKFCCVLLLFHSFCQIETAKLNVPRVLLPLFNEKQTNFTLEVTEGGCYQWSSSREDVVVIKPLQNSIGCSTSARVTSAARLSHRNTAIILAEDVHTRQILRCDVIVDLITKLDVTTTTRELYVEEAPEAFDIVAFDNQGNEFTTLEGIDFTWSLISPLKDSEVIRIMNFAESPYEASDSLKALEAKGLRGHTALLEGVRTGAAKVIMRLPQKEYSSVNSVEVTLRVVANLLLVPSEASILEGDSVHFKIVQVKEGRLIELSPSPQYSLEMEHANIASLHPKTGVATGTTHGLTRIFLRDAGADEDTPDFRPPEALLRVGTARRLQLAGRPVPPSKPWALQKGQPFSIHVQMLDSEDRFMYIGPMTRINVVLDDNLFQVQGRTQNGSVVDGVALTPGKVGITAILVSVAHKNVYPKISTSGEMFIYEGIELIPSNVILDISTVRPEFQMNARGGDGSYSWHREGSLIAVDRHGRLTGLALGKAIVVASLPNNPHINATANVKVVAASDMEVVWNDGEASIDSTVSLHIALYAHLDNDGVVPITSCDNTPFEVNPVDGVAFEYLSKPFRNLQDQKKYGDACTILHVKCTEVGSITAVVARGKLQKEVTLSCHKPLTRVYPPAQHQALILAVGSSANVIYSGGPASWSSDVEPVHNITMSDADTATGVLYKQSAYSSDYSNVYTVTCLKLGPAEMDVRILRGDAGTLLASAKLYIQCNSPHALRITLRQPADSHCPITHPSQVRVLSNSSPLTLQISVADVKGYIFHNASSLRIKWSSLPSILAQQQLTKEILLTQLDEAFAPIPVVAYHYQTVVASEADLTSEGGSGEVIGEIIGYWNNVLKEVGATRTPQLSETPRATITLRSVKPLQISQEKLILYNSPLNEGSVMIHHGSSHVDVQVTSPAILKHHLDKNGQSLKLQILKEGQVTVIIRDKCVSSPPVVLQVSVVSAYGINSDLPPLIEKGATVECRAYLTDRTGAPLPRNVVGAPNITAVPVNSAGEISVNFIAAKSGEAIFKVLGLEQGDARIDFSSLTLVSSSPTHVFPPLRIIPSSSVLLRGSSLALTTAGGPPPPSTIIFYHPTDAQQSNVAKIHSNGILDALAIGTTRVEARAELGGVSYGRAPASIRVIHLEGVNVHAPTAKLLVGNSMPLWATGISDNVGPLELGSQPSLHFTWSVSGDGGAIIYDILEETNIEIEDKDRVSVRLRAVRPGRAKIHLNVTVDRNSMAVGKRHTWSSTLDLMLVEPLQLISPVVNSPNLLLAPDSSTHLKTNYGLDKVTYKIVDEDSSSSGSGPLVVVDSKGVLKSFSRLGRAVLLITGVNNKLETQQHITVSIEVVPVSYTMLDLLPDPNFSGLQALPQGLRLSIVGNRHDSLGRSIAGHVINLDHYSTRSDAIHVKTLSNNTLEVILSEAGRSVFKLTDMDSEFSDYVVLKVAPAIYPSQFVATVGDCWCSRSGVSEASWSSSDPRSLSVSSNGLVQVLADGPTPAHVILRADDVDLRASSSVQIRHADKISFLDTDSEHVFTDERPYTIPLVVYNHEESNKLTNMLFADTDCLTHDLTSFPFGCEIKHNTDGIPPSQLNVEPVLDVEQKTYGCRLTWTPTLSLQPYDSDDNEDSTAITKSNNYSSPGVNTKVTVVAKLGPSVSTHVQARGIRAANPTTRTLHLSPPPALAAQLDIVAPIEVLAQLELVSETDALTVSEPEKVSEIMTRYIVSGKHGTSKGMIRSHVRMISPLTRQDVEIAVNFGSSSSLTGGFCPTGGSSPLLSFVGDYSGYLILFFSCVLVMAVTLMFINKHIRPLMTAGRIPLKDEHQIGSPGFHAFSSSPGLRNASVFVSRSPLSPSPSQHHTSPTLRTQPLSLSPSMSGESSIYGDTSYMSTPERRRNKRLI